MAHEQFQSRSEAKDSMVADVLGARLDLHEYRAELLGKMEDVRKNIKKITDHAVGETAGDDDTPYEQGERSAELAEEFAEVNEPFSARSLDRDAAIQGKVDPLLAICDRQTTLEQVVQQNDRVQEEVDGGVIADLVDRTMWRVGEIKYDPLLYALARRENPEKSSDAKPEDDGEFEDDYVQVLWQEVRAEVLSRFDLPPDTEAFNVARL